LDSILLFLSELVDAGVGIEHDCNPAEAGRNPRGSWSILATGDFDGDQISDILWRDTSGNLAIWFMVDGGIQCVCSSRLLLWLLR
jgi:hypothetical protein